MTVSLSLPIEKAVRLDIDRLVETFSVAAEAAGGELLDDSESLGDWEWFELDRLSADQVRELASRVVPGHRDIAVADHAPDDDEWRGVHVVLT